MKGNKMRLEYKNQYENAFKFWEIKIESKNKVITLLVLILSNGAGGTSLKLLVLPKPTASAFGRPRVI